MKGTVLSMALFLIEIPLETHDEAGLEARLDELVQKLQSEGGDLVEAQVGQEAGQVYLIVDAPQSEVGQAAVESVGFTVDQTKEVRLVGQDVERAKETSGKANYLVEWNLPAGLSMERYLQRKAEKSPLYEQVPEISFERTYVCEDMTKCLCFYNSPDEETVTKARSVVEAPIDKLSTVRKIR